MSVCGRIIVYLYVFSWANTTVVPLVWNVFVLPFLMTFLFYKWPCNTAIALAVHTLNLWYQIVFVYKCPNWSLICTLLTEGAWNVEMVFTMDS
jgi:hypothetical protein